MYAAWVKHKSTVLSEVSQEEQTNVVCLRGWT